MMQEKAVEKIKAKFSNAVGEVTEFRNQLTVLVDLGAIGDVCRFLRDDDDLRFDMAVDVIGLDRNPDPSASANRGYVNDPFDRSLRTIDETYSSDERFEVLYQLYSTKHKEYLRLKVRVPEHGVKVPSVVPVWPSADWHEREVYDMFGIEFEGHPDLRRIYMPEFFEYFPLRKDFPLLGIPGSLPLPDKQ